MSTSYAKYSGFGGGSSTTPGGTNGELQYNNNGVFAGDTATTDGAGNISLTSVTASSLTANTALIANGSKQIASNVTTSTELSYVSGVTSSIQTQLNGKQATLTIGNFTDSSAGADGITVTGGTGSIIGTGVAINQAKAATSQNGYLSSADWNTFNNKQASGNYITALTGDGTATGPGSATLTLATVATAGTTGSSTSIPSVTINAKGLVTSITGNAVVAPAGTLTGTTLASNVVTSSLTTLGLTTAGIVRTTAAGALSSAELSGDVTTSGSNAASVVKVNGLAIPVSKTIVGTNASGQFIDATSSTLSNNTTGTAANITATSNSTLTTLSSLSLPTTQLSGNISLTTQVTGVLPIANGGTDNGSLAVTAGGVIYTDGTKFQNVGAGTSGYVLTSAGASAPTWSAVSVSNAVSAVKTSAYSILTTDYLVLTNASGGSFTVTLPTAVGVTGKTYIIKREDQTLANAVTIATTSSQTIDGVTTQHLATQYEAVTVISDGANWQMLDRRIPLNISTYSPTYTGLGTVTNNTANWSRDGKYLIVQGSVTTGTTNGTNATISLPSGLTTDSGVPISGTGYALVGTWVRGTTSAAVYNIVAAASATTVGIAPSAAGANGLQPAPGNNIGNSENEAFYFEVPITGWEG